ncbi:hypothetical protein KCP77_03820 [Salmonella enterica subsp. enterica]|nr:hypothetical protein KCP77_03820 [Salmonella enterica subsp. enterica]
METPGIRSVSPAILRRGQHTLTAGATASPGAVDKYRTRKHTHRFCILRDQRTVFLLASLTWAAACPQLCFDAVCVAIFIHCGIQYGLTARFPIG